MLTDLVTPWLAAAREGLSGRETFRSTCSGLLGELARIHTPHLPELPLDHPLDPLHEQQFSRDISTLQATPERQFRIAADGNDSSLRVVLLPSSALIDPFVVIPCPAPILVLGTRRSASPLPVVITHAKALVHQWQRSGQDVWDPWLLARNSPLREWYNREVQAWHTSLQVHHDLPPHQILGVTRTAWQRLRQQERRWRRLLEADLDRPGVANLFRWFPPDGRSGLPVHDSLAIPPRMGQYLAISEQRAAER